MNEAITRRDALKAAAAAIFPFALPMATVAATEQVPVTRGMRAYSAAEADALLKGELEGRFAIYRRWLESGQLLPAGGMSSKVHQAVDLAVLLENQQIADASAGGYEDAKIGHEKLHLDLVRRVFHPDAPFRVLANHWTVLGPKGHVFWSDDPAVSPMGHDEVEVRSDRRKIIWSYQHAESCKGEFADELKGVMGEEVQLEIVNGLVGFLKQHVVVVHGVRPNAFADGVRHVRRQVAHETGRTPDVMHIGRDIACLLGVKDDGLFPFLSVATWEDMRVVVNAMASTALMTYRGEGQFAGDATVVSYLPFIPTPLVKLANSDEWRHGYCHRHGGVILRGDRKPAVGMVVVRN